MATQHTIRRTSLRRQIPLVLLGNVIYAACQWGMVVVLAKLTAPEIVGRFALGFAVAAPVMMLGGLQLRTLLVTDSQTSYRFTDYLAVRVVTCVLAMVAILAVVRCAGYGTEAAAVVLAVGLVKVVESLGDVFYGLFQKYEQMSYVATSMAMKGPLSLATLATCLLFGADIFWAIIAVAGALLAAFLLYDLRVALSLLRQGHNQRRTDENEATQFAPHGRRTPSRFGASLALVASGVPLGLVVALNSLSQNIPRYWLEADWGERELGIFSAMAIFMRVGFYLETALVQPALPRLSRLFAQGEHQRAIRLLGRLAALAGAVGLGQVIVSVTMGRPLLAFVYAPQYATYNGVFVCLMLAAAIGYLAGVFKAAADATRTFLAQLPLFAGAVSVSAAAAWILVPRYGLLGAALTVVSAKSMLLIGYALILAHALRRCVPATGPSTPFRLASSRELSR